MRREKLVGLAGEAGGGGCCCCCDRNSACCFDWSRSKVGEARLEVVEADHLLRFRKPSLAAPRLLALERRREFVSESGGSDGAFSAMGVTSAEGPTDAELGESADSKPRGGGRRDEVLGRLAAKKEGGVAAGGRGGNPSMLGFRVREALEKYLRSEATWALMALSSRLPPL